MLKQILNDLIHMTQLEFIINHPFVFIGMLVMIGSIAYLGMIIVDYFRRK